MTEGPRIAPLPPAQWPTEMRDALAALIPPKPRHPLPSKGSGPKGLNALGTLAQYPELARAFQTLQGHLLFATTLSLRQRELVVLRVASVRKASYEWAQHKVQAKNAGLTADEIDRIAEGSQATGWLPAERAMLAAVDELLSDASISDTTWGALAAELDRHQLMDLVFTIGAFDIVAMAFNSFGVELDDDLQPP